MIETNIGSMPDEDYEYINYWQCGYEIKEDFEEDCRLEQYYESKGVE